jgi:hypothetical protein
VKITGIILALIGLAGGVFCMVPTILPDGPNHEVPRASEDQVSRPTMIVPLAICGAAVVVGGLMFVYGGKGYYVSNNPNVTN